MKCTAALLTFTNLSINWCEGAVSFLFTGMKGGGPDRGALLR